MAQTMRPVALLTLLLWNCSFQNPGPDGRDNGPCAVPLGTSSSELAAFPRPNVVFTQQLVPFEVSVGQNPCPPGQPCRRCTTQPDGGRLVDQCAEIAGSPHSGGNCKSEGGHWQCWVWLQDDKVVGLLGLCDD